jgi:hypothetical protein
MSDLSEFLKRGPMMSPVAERAIPSNAGRVRRVPMRIRHIMVGVVWCALLFTLHRSMLIERLPALLIFTLGPICGAIAQRCWGGRGILGGMIGGMISYLGVGVAWYLWDSLYPQPNSVKLLGPAVIFEVLLFYGVVVGTIAGILVWGVSLIPVTSVKC